MNGIEVLEAMGPAGLTSGVIVVSSLTTKGGEMTVRALELGRVRFHHQAGPRRAGRKPGPVAGERLQPMIRAFERRRDIRSMLGRETAGRQQVEIPLDRLVSPATEVRSKRTAIRGPSLVLIGNFYRRTGRPGDRSASASGRPERPCFHCPAYAGDVHQALGSQPLQKERPPREGGRGWRNGAGELRLPGAGWRPDEGGCRGREEKSSYGLPTTRRRMDVSPRWTTCFARLRYNFRAALWRPF